jgi:cell division protein FtsW
MIYSSSVIVTERLGVPPYFYFQRQVVWIIFGLIAGFLLYRVNYRLLAKFSLPALIVSIILLVVVILVNIDQPIKRWINLGPFDLQASEVTKLTFLLYLSHWLSRKRDKSKTEQRIKEHIKYELIPFLFLLSFVSILIIIEPDMDTAIMLAITSFIVYYVSGNDLLHTLGSITTAAISALLIVVTTVIAKYRLQRITTFIDFAQDPDPDNKAIS